MSFRRSEFLRGVRAEFPLLIGVIPFGMIYGVLALGAGIPAGVALAMSSVIFAGSSQFVAAQLIGVGTPGLIIVATAGIINLRHALYSASVAPYLRRLHPLWKWLLAYLLTDEAYVVTISYYLEEGIAPHRHWYFLGAGLTLWSAWQASTAIGLFLGAQVPASWSLDFTLALTFIALLVPALKDRAAVAAALTAGIAALVAADLPFRLGLVVAALVGITAGLWVESR